MKPKILIVSAIISFFALAKYDFFITRYFPNLPNLPSLYTAVSLVKTKESVLTTANIAPHLAKRQTIKLISKDRPSEKYNDIFKYIVLDLINNKSEFIPDLIYQLKNSSNFKLVYEADNVFLFIKV